MGSVLSWNKAAELPTPPSLANDDEALPTDLLYEILLRLPAKELCRLRHVCRSWRSLTSDPGFAKAHAFCHPLVICIHDDDDEDDDSHYHPEVRIVDLSGNIIKRVPLEHWGLDLSAQLDLVCVRPYWNRRRDPWSVLNLNLTTIEATTTLPDSTRGHGIDQSILGYVPSTGEYKVLRTHRFATCDHEGNHHSEQTCDVMTLGAPSGGGRWRARQGPPELLSLQSRQVAVVNGVAYFLLCQYNRNKLKPDTIASFDMASEEWRKEMLRGPVNNNHAVVDQNHMYNLELAVLDSCLVMLQDGFRECSVDLWFLEEMDKGLWTKLCTAQYGLTPVYKINALFSPYPLLVLEDGKIVMWVAGKQLLRVYDPRRRTWTDLTELEHCCGVNMYAGNLLSTDQVYKD